MTVLLESIDQFILMLVQVIVTYKLDSFEVSKNFLGHQD